MEEESRRRRRRIDGVDERIWLKAPQYWRTQAVRPFTDWRFSIHSDVCPPRDMCERIIVAGHGQVVDSEETIALVPPDIDASDPWLQAKDELGIPCVDAGFIIDYLTKPQEPNPPRIEEYQIKFKPKRRGRRR